MAEYCKKCAEASNGKYFFDGFPVFCEICKKEYNGNWFERLWESVRIIFYQIIP